MNTPDAPINMSLYSAGPVDDYVLTYTGSLIGGLELSGIDPQSLGSVDYNRVTSVMRSIIQSLNLNIVVTQYYFHFDDLRSVKFRERNHPRNKVLSKRRADFINRTRRVGGARLFWLLEIPQEQSANKVASIAFLKLIFESIFSKDARERIKLMLDYKGSFLIEREELVSQIKLLTSEISKYGSRVEAMSRNYRFLSRGEIWRLFNAISNLNPGYFFKPRSEQIPTDAWDSQIPDGDCEAVQLGDLNVLKIDGPSPVYARVASVLSIGESAVPEAVWARGGEGGEGSPTLLPGNYLLVTRLRPMSRLARGAMLKGKENELFRSQVSLTRLLKGDTPSTEADRQMQASESLKRQLTELEDASETPDRYWHYSGHVVIFESRRATDGLQQLREGNPLSESAQLGIISSRIDKTSRAMSTALDEAGIRVVWESAGLMDVWPTLQPGFPTVSTRTIQMTSSQAAASSLIYKPHLGLPTWTVGNVTEESIITFESSDGSPFHYTPFIGDKCLALCVGPTRSGKSFLRNLIAAHYMKFQSRYATVDVDSGSEGTAAFFGHEAGLFRLVGDTTKDRGFNIFAAADLSQLPANGGKGDSAFNHHFLTQIRLMVSLNDSEALQTISSEDQRDIDHALQQTLSISDPNLRNFSTFINHCNANLRLKLARWKSGEGPYGHFFDNQVDGVGETAKRFSAFNISGVKDMPELATLVMNEIFFRLIREFESDDNRSVPKLLDMDEAQYSLSIPGAAQLVVAKARTWFKYRGGMSFWTQSPSHYANLPEWETLRSSATTFWFCADPNMDRESYRETFRLSEGHLDRIQSLIPRKQAFIYQPEIGVAKVVNIIAAPEEYVLATSDAAEQPIVQKALRENSDVDTAIDIAVNELSEIIKKRMQ